MADPLTSNVGLAVPTRGSDVGTWDTPVNNDMTAIDGMIGGVFAQSLTNANVTLSVPAGFTATPSAGPTQSQNAIIRFTGTLTGNCIITFPRPGIYVVENRCTVGAFYVQLTNGGGGDVIGVPPGRAVDVYSDGTNMRFRNLPEIGSFMDLCGVTTVPAWIGACTVPPWLYCDGSVYNVATYPFLGAMLGSTFGGNGSTTFGVPDHRNRFRAPFGTGGGQLITNSGSGIHGETVGASGGNELTQAHNHTFNGTPTGTLTSNQNNVDLGIIGGSQGTAQGIQGVSSTNNSITIPSITPAGTISSFGGGNSGNMPPTLIFGISLIRSG